MSQETYYGDSSQHGQYQWIVLEDMVNDFMAVHGDEGFMKNVPRYKVIYHMKRAVREFTFDVLSIIKAIKLDVSATLQVTLPPDYVEYARLSWVDDEGKLYPITENNKLDITFAYLQDNDYNLLYDADGNILEDTSVIDPNELAETNNLSYYEFCPPGFSPNQDMSQDYRNGSFKIDRDRGRIQFDRDLYQKSLVLEYVSDGLYYDSNTGMDQTERDIKVPKMAEQGIIDMVYYQIIKMKSFVSQGEKNRARKEYYNSKRRTKRRLSKANKEELIQAMKGSNKWIKGNDISY